MSHTKHDTIRTHETNIPAGNHQQTRVCAKTFPTALHCLHSTNNEQIELTPGGKCVSCTSLSPFTHLGQNRCVHRRSSCHGLQHLSRLTGAGSHGAHSRGGFRDGLARERLPCVERGHEGTALSQKAESCEGYTELHRAVLSLPLPDRFLVEWE